MGLWKLRVEKSLTRLGEEIGETRRIAKAAKELAQTAFQRTCEHSYVDLMHGIIVSARCVKCGELQPGYEETCPGGPIMKKTRK
jgi:hypothetical protein